MLSTDFITLCYIKHKLEERCFVQRTKDLHQYHLSAIDNGVHNGALVYGIITKCPFEELSYFNTTDFLEGIIPTLLKLLIREFHRDFVSLQRINEELRTFKFGANDRSSRPVEFKDSLLRDNGHIVGSASQKLCLFLKLPLIVGHYIPTGNKHWELYALCRDIGDVLLAPKIDAKWIPILEANIYSFLFSFNDLFPGCLTPKFHYLLHYPRLILEFGPIRLLWCMRFEAKHQYFKTLAGRLHNFKNVAQSFAKRHQMRQCWEMSSVDVLKQDTVSQGGTPVAYGSLSSQAQSAILNFCGLDPTQIETSEKVWKLTSLTVDHVTYRPGCMLVLDVVHAEDIPVFFRVTHCLKLRSSWLLCGRIYYSARFSAHYHGYLVHDCGETVVISPGQECDHQSLDLYTTEDSDSVVILDYLPCANC